VAKPDLSIRWSKREGALLYHHEGDKPTSGMLAGVFEHTQMQMHYTTLINDERYINAMWGDDRTRRERTLAQDLEARGYDLTTLRFSIRKKR
jgi:hypothetical protein